MLLTYPKSRYLQCKHKNNHSRPTPECSNYYGCFNSAAAPQGDNGGLGADW